MVDSEWVDPECLVFKRHISAAFLQFFFMFFDLLLQFRNDLIDRAKQITGLITGIEIVSFFGCNGNFHARLIGFFQIYDNFDGGQSFKKPLKFFDFLCNFFLCSVAYFAVSCGNVYQHDGNVMGKTGYG